MIPRSQHFRDRAPFPQSGSGIVRIFEKAAFEALFIPTGSRAHYSGKQPNASVQQHQRAHLSAGQDDVAHADLLDRPRVENPLVKSLEPAAQDCGPRTGGDLPDVSDFVARKPELPDRLRRAVVSDNADQFDGTPLRPDTVIGLSTVALFEIV